ncbi:hypothetical protein PVAND_013658 [Polypedilum vanderplanki]|uniref:CHHC U11-48K-type domain-containing protein n=1 Tax=Polypedilum vanderplanki TaxID=319348 RepID=A0A9J6CR58_POLVA|nr:hypothetical protein PVAND_013658 [Polypedilum vanderplanki]
MASAYFSVDSLPESERLEACPYNPAHMVVAHRMSKHLIKCRKSHSVQGTAVCKFNVMHVLPTQEIDYHHRTCTDRILVERFIEVQQELNNNNDVDSGIQSTVCSQVGQDEDWDKDQDAPSGVLRVKDKAKKANVVLNIQHDIPSERKRRRKEEAQRLRNLRDSAF